jgi:hypothetical protein
MGHPHLGMRHAAFTQGDPAKIAVMTKVIRIVKIRGWWSLQHWMTCCGTPRAWSLAGRDIGGSLEGLPVMLTLRGVPSGWAAPRYRNSTLTPVSCHPPGGRHRA